MSKCFDALQMQAISEQTQSLDEERLTMRETIKEAAEATTGYTKKLSKNESQPLQSGWLSASNKFQTENHICASECEENATCLLRLMSTSTGRKLPMTWKMMVEDLTTGRCILS